MAQVLGEVSPTVRLTHAVITCSCEEQGNNSAEQLFCLLIMEPAKQLAAT